MKKKVAPKKQSRPAGEITNTVYDLSDFIKEIKARKNYEYHNKEANSGEYRLGGGLPIYTYELYEILAAEGLNVPVTLHYKDGYMGKREAAIFHKKNGEVLKVPAGPVKRHSFTEISVFNGADFIPDYVAAAKEGEAYFDREFDIKNIYAANSKEYLKTVHNNIFHNELTGGVFKTIPKEFRGQSGEIINGAAITGAGWLFVKHKIPTYISKKTIREFGFYTGIMNRVENLCRTHPAFSGVLVCKDAPAAKSGSLNSLGDLLGEENLQNLTWILGAAKQINEKGLVENTRGLAAIAIAARKYCIEKGWIANNDNSNIPFGRLFVAQYGKNKKYGGKSGNTFSKAGEEQKDIIDKILQKLNAQK